MVKESATSGVQKVISGGQTGVDQGALESAIELGLDHGGWCPRGRLCENGQIPFRFQLTETSSPEYWVRTERNVLDSDATLILFRGHLSGGTALTHRMAVKHQRPCLLIDLDQPPERQEVWRWLQQNAVRVLNVAGPRESSCPGIGDQARAFVRAVFREEKTSIE